MVTDIANELQFTIYISRAARAFEDTDLVDIAAKAEDNNKRLDVTGLLLRAGNHFIQILEGPSQAVQTLISTIRKDPRHTDLRIIFKESVPARRFGQWSTDYLPVEGVSDIGVSEAIDLKKEAEEYMRIGTDPKPILNFIQHLSRFFSLHKMK